MTTDAINQPVRIHYRDASQDNKGVQRVALALNTTLPESERLLYIVRQSALAGALRKVTIAATSDHLLIRRPRLINGHRDTWIAWWDVKSVTLRRGIFRGITVTLFDGRRYRVGRLRPSQADRLRTIAAECQSDWREKRRQWDRAQVEARWGAA